MRRLLPLSLFSLSFFSSLSHAPTGTVAPRLGVLVAVAGEAPTAEQRAFEQSLRSASQAAPAPALPYPQTNGTSPAAASAPAPKAAITKTASVTYEFSDGDVNGQLGTSEMRRANRAAAEILQRRMAEERPDDLKLIREAVGADVVVVQGVYDRVQDVLRAVQIKHVVIPGHLLDRIDLLSTQTLMVNCPGELSEVAVKKIRSFVERGGYLVTTDWALKLTARAFPGTIEHNGKATPNDVVSVHVHDDNEPLLRHVKVMRDHPRWWLEGSSYPIRIKDKSKVRVLMSSEEMEKKYGDGAVVVSFHHQQGKVLHMTSHFFLQQSKLVAESEKQSGSKFAKGAGLSDKDVESLKKSGVNLDEVRAGELNSAYSMQQVSTNLVVEKQARNKELLQKTYRGRITRESVQLADSETATPTATPAQATPAGTAAAPAAKTLQKDFRVQVLERKNGKAKVRDLFGREGWLPADAVLE